MKVTYLLLARPIPSKTKLKHIISTAMILTGQHNQMVGFNILMMAIGVVVLSRA